VTIPHVPVPFAVSLEDYVTPTAERIAQAARALVR
jgi:pyruvate/2-oxoglutarate/acetoin dehydrogenase E1 component